VGEDRLLSKAVERIVRELRMRAVILFGSRARGLEALKRL